jgi:hypothetical protein
VPFGEPLQGLVATVKIAAQAAFSADLPYFALQNANLRPANGWGSVAGAVFCRAWQTPKEPLHNLFRMLALYRQDGIRG